MAATLSGAYNSSAPDTPSPIYPDRLIRPLPKRPIRSRLSREAAESILYPPAPPATQLFYGAYAANGDAVNDAKVYVQQNAYAFEGSPERDHHYDDGVDSGDEDGHVVIRRSGGFHRASMSPSLQGDNRQKYAKHSEGTPSKPPSSGPDGYDAFENTNNKKKRKIPTSGNLGSHSNLSADISNMGLSAGGNGVSSDDGSGTGSYYGTGHPASPAGSGMSGPGRGRYGRAAARSLSGRMPFSVHNPNAWMGGKPGVNRRDAALSEPQESLGDSPNNIDQGIISQAIANAAALSSSAPQLNNENTSLLDQTKKSPPVKTQFTFTCESDVSKGIAWQTPNPYSVPAHHRSSTQPLAAAAPGQRGFSTQGTQTSPNMATQANQQGQHPPQGGQTPTGGKKTRRSAASLYALAARQRRIQQQYTNLHHPPSLEDIWICEFCEYESIFGHPPEALIRQYEIKDRKERRRLAEKRRLLEKAKMKGRKGKKATKNAAAKAAAAQQQQQSHHQQGYDRHHGMDHDPGNSHLGDDYPADEYDDDVSIPPAPQSNAPHKQPPLPNSNTAKPNPTASGSSKGTGTGTGAATGAGAVGGGGDRAG
ncbi:hypothetical protein AJ80_09281 [Polytolypa hystricis UAMH7299]|uniref:Uncharacterized protein n=1 Tax=Polytolypa hystricis (strain UAMH7299) TaxID=1447883 RepID=A0A2B7WTD9_POLH7|nr:hypothetical protein AJ80_09281 [Polytolypa hystricis UAMH7299]